MNAAEARKVAEAQVPTAKIEARAAELVAKIRSQIEVKAKAGSFSVRFPIGAELLEGHDQRWMEITQKAIEVILHKDGFLTEWENGSAKALTVRW